MEAGALVWRESESWQFKRDELPQGSLIRWALFGSTERDSIRSLRTVEVAPEEAMSIPLRVACMAPTAWSAFGMRHDVVWPELSRPRPSVPRRFRSKAAEMVGEGFLAVAA